MHIYIYIYIYAVLYFDKNKVKFRDMDGSNTTLLTRVRSGLDRIYATIYSLYTELKGREPVRRDQMLHQNQMEGKLS